MSKSSCITRFLILSLFCILISHITLEAQQKEYDVIVAQDGSGDYTRIQDAINGVKAFPHKRITIFIRAGVYKEKVRVYSWNTNLSLVGDTLGETVITYNDHFKKINLGRNSTFHTYTLKVEGNDFFASNLTIENSAGEVGQAVALHIEADRVVVKNCTIKGYQDTMYLAGEGARQYFTHCRIYGATDYIFGNATALFDSCEVISLKPSYITAASTTRDTNYGFVFRNCTLSSDDLPGGSTYLGRPWRPHAKTVFINCKLGAYIHPLGWKEWNANGTAFYAEYNSQGPGANPKGRVEWSHQLSSLEAYTVESIFSGWTPNINL